MPQGSGDPEVDVGNIGQAGRDDLLEGAEGHAFVHQPNDVARCTREIRLEVDGRARWRWLGERDLQPERIKVALGCHGASSDRGNEARKQKQPAPCPSSAGAMHRPASSSGAMPGCYE